ncbi:MAG: pyruvate kinase, partial [Bacteroidota bacterium]
MQKTKIVATISERQCDVNFIRKLYNEGMNVVRMNTAHQEPEDTLKVISNVRQVSDRIALLIDTKGPEVR